MAAAEQRKQYKVVKNFRGIDTRSNRTAVEENEFAWLENAQPIGPSNLKIVPAQVTVTNATGVTVTWANTTNYLFSGTINASDGILSFQDNGGCEVFNITTALKNTVATSGTFSTSGVRAQQWKNERILIVDPAKGLYSWDGSSVIPIGSVGQIGIVSGGSGYTSAPSVAISAPNVAGGKQATAQVFITAGAVTSIALTEPGTGYTSQPTITFNGGGGAGASAIASYISFATGTVACFVGSGGTGYSSTPTISFSGGGGSGAAAKAIVVGGVITQIIMTNLGTNYTSNPTVTVTDGTGSGAVVTAIATTNANVDVATFSGRAWVAQGRTVFYSAAGSYNDFITVSAGSVTLTDSTLHGNLQSLLSANNFLYLFGDDSINVFSDVRVQSNGSTIFTNTNVSASIGTKRINSIFPYFRSVVFMNDNGVYALVGSTTTKLSDALDGVFPYIDFTKPVTGAQVMLNNILCVVLSFYYNDPLGNPRWLQGVYFDKRWFFTNQGTVKLMAGVPVGGTANIYATDGTSLVRLYQDATASIASIIRSALWALQDPIRDKQALKFAVEATLSSAGSFTATVDSEYQASPPYSLAANTIGWVNNLGNVIGWTNNSLATIGWINAGYQLYKSDAQQWGKYLGITLTSNSGGFVVNTLEMEYEMRARF